MYSTVITPAELKQSELPKTIITQDPRMVHMSWCSLDAQLWYKQEFQAYGNGRLVPFGDVIVGPYPQSLKDVRVTDEEGKELIENPPPLPSIKGRKCAGCGKAAKAEVIRWFGIRWYGIPMPVRRLRRWFTKDAPAMDSYDGCGCIIKLKTAWLVLQQFRRLAVVGSKRVWTA